MPTRADSGLYAEHWILYPNYVYPNARKGIKAEIVPEANQTYTSEADFFGRAPFSAGFPLRLRNFQRQQPFPAALTAAVCGSSAKDKENDMTTKMNQLMRLIAALVLRTRVALPKQRKNLSASAYDVHLLHSFDSLYRHTSRPSSVFHDVGYMPLPWDALYNFGRQICVGCMVTFGPRSSHKAKQVPDSKADFLRLQIVRIEGRTGDGSADSRIAQKHV